MTFSIVARCMDTGMFGVAVSSSSPAVAARCAHARAGVGAIASQNITDPALGTRGLDLMALGATAPEAVAILKATGAHIEYRQIAAVGADGQVAVHTGAKVLGTWGQSMTRGAMAAGNLLADPGVPEAMITAFRKNSGPLGDRLILAMSAAVAAGGETVPVHSAGMMLVDKVPWPVADLRIDWSDGDPIEELARLWDLYKPQLDDYVTRALDPAAAPSYGVPGDE